MSLQISPEYLWKYDERRNIHPIFSSILYHPRIQQCIELVQSQSDIERAAYDISRELSQVEEIVLSSKPGSTVLLPKLRSEFTTRQSINGQIYELRTNDVGNYWQAIFTNAYTPMQVLHTLPSQKRPESPERRAFLHAVNIIAFMLALRELAGHLANGNAPCSHRPKLKHLEEAVAKMQNRLDTLEAQGTYMADKYLLDALTRWRTQIKHCQRYEQAVCAKADALSKVRKARRHAFECEDRHNQADNRARASREGIYASVQRSEANRRAVALDALCQTALHALQDAREAIVRAESLLNHWTAECEKRRRIYDARYEPARQQLRSEVDRVLKYNERRLRYNATSRYL